MIFVYRRFCFALCLGTVLVCLWGTDVQTFGKFSDWKFDPVVFEERSFQDWLMQDVADAKDRTRVFSGSEFQLERSLVDRVLTQTEELDADVSELRARLSELVGKKTHGNDPQWRRLYTDACKTRREARLADAVELAPRFVYTKHYVIGASHYAYTEDVTDEAHRDFSQDRSAGGQLCLAEFLSDGTIRHEVLVETKEGTIRDPDVSWDAKKILFSMRADYIDDDFHLYEYDMETRKTRQITYGAGVADIEPIYLPNGDLLFTSTRCMQITDCSWAEVSNLFTCDAQGRFLRRVSVDQVTVNYPKLLDDGRVIYTRWDYNDRGQIFPQPLFQMNPDGTGQTEYYGNNSYFPTTIMHARGIPGTDKVIALASGHHVHQHGKLILLDRNVGSQENSGATLLAPIRGVDADRVDVYGQRGELFQYPYPLDETTLLCAYLPEGASWKNDVARSYPIPFGVYWFDHDGNRELLAYDPQISCGQPIPLVEREIPKTRPTQVDYSQSSGKFFVQDVYEGPGLSGVERGTIKSLRVVALDFRAAGIRSNENHGPAGAAMVCTPVSVSNGTWDVKRVLGTVPVEEDGSAFFEVPALTPVYFQLLDKNGDCVQTMRSWSTLQPGETFGCVGCHEPKGNIVENAEAASGSTSAALRKGATQLAPELTLGPGRFQDAGFSFTRDVQPILDKYCVRCHTGEQLTDGARAPFSLRGNLDVTRAGKEACAKSGRFFSEAYLNLTNYGNNDGKYVDWLNVQEGPELLEPYHAGAFKSKLISMFRDREGNVEAQDEFHRGVDIDANSLHILALWIDLLVPYCGDYVEQANWTRDERARYDYYLAKQIGMKNLVAENMERKRVTDATGVLPDPSDFHWTDFGGRSDRDVFLAGWFARRIPSAARRIGKWNVYRNLALNPRDVQGDAEEARSYPHATSNSEYAYLDEFAAKNVIDGRTSNEGHGPKFPSWGPNLRGDLWLNIDFGCEVEIDKAVIYLRADFPHDAAWTSGTLEFSDGTFLNVEFKKTSEPQEFRFPRRRVRSVRLTNLKTDSPEVWHGITEIEFWGVSI